MTTFLSILRVSDLETLSRTITIPEILTTITEITEDSAGSPTTIFSSWTLERARTTTEPFEITSDVGPNFITTTITSTIRGNVISAHTTLIEDTTTILGATVENLVTSTDSLGKVVTTLVDSTLPARTITTQEISTISDHSIVQASGIRLDTQQQRLLASSAGIPTFRILVSTLHYATVVPTSVPTVAPDPSDGLNGTDLEVLGLSTVEYFFGEFLSTLLAVVASLFIEVIGNNAKLMQPFVALASSNSGATAESSIFLRFDEWFGALMIPQAIRLKQPLIVITQLVVIGSQIIAPLSAEAVQIYTSNSCTASCYGKIAVQRPVARALEGLLGATAVLLVMVVIITNLRSFRTGVRHNPWSTASMASLCGHPDVRTLLSRISQGTDRAIDEESIAKVLAGHNYVLGHFSDSSRHISGEAGYGLVLDEDENASAQNTTQLLNDAENIGPVAQSAHARGALGTKVSPWLRPLTLWFRLAFLGLIASVLSIVIYYQQTTGQSGFEMFMDSRGFGVRFLFTGLGVLLGGLMGAIFECGSLLQSQIIYLPKL